MRVAPASARLVQVPRPPQQPIAAERLKQGAVGALYELAAAGPTNALFRAEIASDPAPAARGWQTLARDPNVRRLTVRAVLREMARMSDELVAALDNAKLRGAKPYWHTVIIGAGIHATEVAHAMAASGKAQSILTVDEARTPAGKFGSAGATFRINSDNDLLTNPIASPVGVQDIAGTKWPAAHALADSATIGLFSSGSDFLFGSKVVSVAKMPAGADWPGRYKIGTANGREVYADNVVVAAGLGEPQIPFADAQSKALVAAERAKVDESTPDAVPDVLLFEDAMRLANLSTTPLAPYRKKRTAVVGAGDGARVFLELLLRYAPDEAYTGSGKNEVAARGSVGDVKWFVGSKGPKDAREYSEQAWARYRPLAKSIHDGQVTTVQARADAIERLPSGELKLTYKDAQGNAQSEIVDRVVLCTGFDNQVDQVLAAAGKAEQLVHAQVGGKRVAIAKQIAGESVYVCGPAAGELTKGETLTGPNTNPVSIYVLGPRSQALGEQLGAQGSANKFFVPRASAEALAVGSDGRDLLPVVPDTELPTAPAQADLQVKAALAVALDRFRFPGLTKLELSVEQSGKAHLRQLWVTTPQLDEASARKIGRAILADRELHALLTLFTRTGAVRDVSFSVQLGADERIRAATMRMTR